MHNLALTFKKYCYCAHCMNEVVQSEGFKCPLCGEGFCSDDIKSRSIRATGNYDCVESLSPLQKEHCPLDQNILATDYQEVRIILRLK